LTPHIEQTLLKQDRSQSSALQQVLPSASVDGKLTSACCSLLSAHYTWVIGQKARVTVGSRKNRNNLIRFCGQMAQEANTDFGRHAFSYSSPATWNSIAAFKVKSVR